MPGIEFSAEYQGASLHVLAYWIDPADEELQAELKRLTDTRFRRGEMMIEKLQELGYEISFERVQEIAGGGLIARPHVAKAMVEAGHRAHREGGLRPLHQRRRHRVRAEARARPGRAPSS